MRLIQIRCPIPIVRTTAVLLLTVALAACSARGGHSGHELRYRG